MNLYRNCRSLVEKYFSAPGQTGFDFSANYWRIHKRLMKWSRKGVWQTMVQPRNFNSHMKNFHELEIMLPMENVKTKSFSRQANMSIGFCVFTWNDITFLAQIPFPPRMKLARTRFYGIILLLLWHVNFFLLPWLTISAI